jgi:hypothetical protein
MIGVDIIHVSLDCVVGAMEKGHCEELGQPAEVEVGKKGSAWPRQLVTIMFTYLSGGGHDAPNYTREKPRALRPFPFHDDGQAMTLSCPLPPLLRVADNSSENYSPIYLQSTETRAIAKSSFTMSLDSDPYPPLLLPCLMDTETSRTRGLRTHFSAYIDLPKFVHPFSRYPESSKLSP